MNRFDEMMSQGLDRKADAPVKQLCVSTDRISQPVKVSFPLYPHQHSKIRRYFSKYKKTVVDHELIEITCSMRISRDYFSIYLPD